MAHHGTSPRGQRKTGRRGRSSAAGSAELTEAECRTTGRGELPPLIHVTLPEWDWVQHHVAAFARKTRGEGKLLVRFAPPKSQ